jgi:hypothetical protein
MGRYAHRQLQRMLSDRRDKVTDRTLFTSRAMSSVLEDIATAQTRRYTKSRIHVKLEWSNEDWLANTNNSYIRINSKCPHYDNLDRKTRYEMVVGLFAHELGHVLFTDFDAVPRHIEQLLQMEWYPAEPKVLSKWSGKENARKLEQWLHKSDDDPADWYIQRAFFQRFVQRLHNVLEDGHIEELILRKYSGKLGKCLEVMRGFQVREDFTVSTMLDMIADGEICACQMYLDMILMYAKYGIVNYGEATASTLCVQKLFSLIDAIDDAVNIYSADARCAGVNEILITLWTEIEEYLDKQIAAYKEKLDNSSDSIDLEKYADDAMAGSGSAMPSGTGLLVRTDTITGSHPSMRQSSATATKTAAETAANAEEAQDDSESESDTANSQENTAVSAGESQTESSEDDSSASVSDVVSEQSELPEESKNEQCNAESQDDAEEEPVEFGDVNTDGESSQDTDDVSISMPEQEQSKGASREETGRMSRTAGAAEAATGDGEMVYNDDYEASPYENAASDIERILTGVAEDMMETERCVELNDEVKNMDLSEIHANCDININRQQYVDADMVELYDMAAPQLLSISKQLQRSIAKAISDRRTGTKMTGLIYGRRMEARNLSRTDGKVFYKRSLPDDTPLMSVALLMDESGSMESEDRITYARAAAIILQDFCAGLDIPFMCYGHSTSYCANTVELYSYCEFDQIDRKDKYRLMDAQARNSNRDGAALRYVERKLVARPEPTKLLILISDGQPAATGYYGDVAEQDLRQIKTDLRREGVIFVAAAIGSDREVIEDIYGDSYLDISDLRKLPVTLTQLVKKHIRL